MAASEWTYSDAAPEALRGSGRTGSSNIWHSDAWYIAMVLKSNSLGNGLDGGRVLQVEDAVIENPGLGAATSFLARTILTAARLEHGLLFPILLNQPEGRRHCGKRVGDGAFLTWDRPIHTMACSRM